MKMNRYTIQFVAIVLCCLVLVFVLLPSSTTGVIDDSVTKFTKVFGIVISGLIYGSFSGDDSDKNKEGGEGE